MGNLLDTFTGPDGALTPADTGQQPQTLTGAASRFTGRGFATTNRTIVAYDCGVGSEDAVAELDMGSGDGADALYWRIVDRDNWWRLGRVRETRQVQTGTTQVQTGTQTVVVGYTPVEYRWTAAYYGELSLGSGVFHYEYDSRWTSGGQPAFPSTYSHGHDNFFHQMDLQSVTQDATRGGEPITEQQPVFETRPVFTTQVDVHAYLERADAGAVTASLQLPGVQTATRLRATFIGSAVTVQALTAGGTVVQSKSITAPEHARGRRHGWGSHERGSQGALVDNVRVTVTGRRAGLSMIV